ncbi:MAG: hypothetical protein OXU72_13190 [Gammaproteobacteria bacterium]|nr:hypothetical protein [Gammaproteobacteria bacterium]
MAGGTQGRLDAPPQLDWTGVALALGSTIVWASYWLLNARVSIDPIGLIAWSFTFGSLFVGTLCLLGPGLPPLSGLAIIVAGLAVARRGTTATAASS